MWSGAAVAKSLKYYCTIYLTVALSTTVLQVGLNFNPLFKIYGFRLKTVTDEYHDNRDPQNSLCITLEESWWHWTVARGIAFLPTARAVDGFLIR